MSPPSWTSAAEPIRGRWLLSCLGFFLLAGGWAIGLPVNATYDEAQHIPRAYGIANGQIYSPHGTVSAPASLLPADVYCDWSLGRLVASCQTPGPPADTAEGQQLVSWPSAASRYGPVYYFPVGVPLQLAPDAAGVMIARLVSALFSASLLGAALAVAVGCGNPLLAAALLLVTTPSAMSLIGSVNPNGLEISAGILLWTVLLTLLDASGESFLRDGAPPRPRLAVRHLLVLLVAAAVLLMTIRPLGPLLLAASVLACTALASPGRARLLLARRDARVALAITAAAALYAIFWALTASVASIPPNPARAEHWPIGRLIWRILNQRVSFYVNQTVAQFGYGEITMPSWVILGWYAFVAALVLPATLMASRRHRVVALTTAGFLLGVLVALELWFVPRLGWYAQARYVMPAGAGLVLMASFVEPYRRALGERTVRRYVRAAVVATSVLHAWCLGEVVRRYSAALHGGVADVPAVVTALSTSVAGLATLAVVVWGRLDAPRPMSGGA